MTGQQDMIACARRLVREQHRAALGTLLVPDGHPYVSLAMVATDLDGAPLLFLSRLAVHTRNLGADPRASLLFDATRSLAAPLAGERVTLLGRIRPHEDERARARYLRLHPDAERYRAFADFSLYRFEIARAHLVAGFGRIHWIDGRELMVEEAVWGTFAKAESSILNDLNGEHRDLVALLAARLGARRGEDFRAVGVDPEGIDLLARESGARLRLWFDPPVRDAGEVRARLVELARRARREE